MRPERASLRAAARDDVLAMTEEHARLFCQWVAKDGLYRDSDAAQFIPVPKGMFVAVRTWSSPFVIVIPAAGRGANGRPRYYGIRAGAGQPVSMTTSPS